MREIDQFSYQLGVIDCFSEMVHAGVKRIAMSHPCSTKEERDSYLEYCREICGSYGTYFYPEDEAFITDLFPRKLNENKFNIIFYRENADIEEYFRLKAEQKRMQQEGRYTKDARDETARGFGRLLSYTEEAVTRKIHETRIMEGEEDGCAASYKEGSQEIPAL